MYHHSLSGSCAIVAGGSGGIGSAICIALAASGADVAFTYRSNEKAARATEQAIALAGRKHFSRSLDHSDPQALKSFVDESAEIVGPIRSVVYAAGPHIPMAFISALQPDQWKAVIDTDVNGVFNLVWATLPLVREAGGGAYVAVTTAAVKRAPLRDICSAAPKAAIEMLMRGLALEEGRNGIRANCVGPGFIDAGLGRALLGRPEIADWTAELRKSLPLKRFGAASDVAGAVVFLLSSQANYITGQSVAVDGGFQV